MKQFHILLTGVLLGLISCSGPDWKDTTLSPADRAQSLLQQMTLEEKVGKMCQYVGPCYVPPG